MIRKLLVFLLALAPAACGKLPLPAATPTCEIVPMPTGEGIWQLEVRQAPPTQMQAGETAQMSISGGVVVGVQEVRCSDSSELLQPNLSTALATRRTVRVLLGEREVASVECGFECELTFTIPEDIVPGGYTLAIVSSLVRTELPIEVIA